MRNFDFSSLEGIDVVAGGPPCQPFSTGGKHKANDDGRDMFPLAISAIKELQPKAFIFENVKGLLRGSFSDYFDYILLRLRFPDKVKNPTEDWQDHLSELKQSCPRGLCYDVSFKLLNAANYGVPQARERVFIVGVRSDLNVKWSFPEETHSKQVLLYEQQQNGSYWEKHGISPKKVQLEQCCGENRQIQKSFFQNR
ncbi:DNA cytosine methyltransferase [Octadecabacter antarcticus]|uniref:DNA cytosine methyltransferase n=1 Tax=Octadecabacter antarcticus TaxID=1217908 RepID=UPI002FDDDD25